MTFEESLDSLISGRVLVFGSLPPDARDIDLLARPVELDALRAGLTALGFLQRGDQWVRFRACSTESVDVVPSPSLRLPVEEETDLFDEALPITGLAQLVRPAPHHALLILARRLLRGDGRLDAKRRARVELALSEDAGAWETATARAGSWRAGPALALLRDVYESGRRVRVAERAGALGAKAFVRSIVDRRPRRGHIVALSGLDGSGKSSQAEALRSALETAGIPAAVEWTRFSHNTSLDAIAAPVKALVRRGAGEDAGEEAATRLRRESGTIGRVWSAIVAVTNALSHLRLTARHLIAGRVVICDRYVLDSVVQLRDKYGEGLNTQAALIRLLSPRPSRAYFLDVPPETACARKPEQFTLDELTRQAVFYRDAASKLGVQRIDAERPRDEICTEIASDVWFAL